MSLKVLHIDSERGWRGGQNQALLLINGLQANSVQCFFAGPENGALYKKIPSSVKKLNVDMKGLNVFLAAKSIKNFVASNDIQLVDCHSSSAHSAAYVASLLGMQTPIVVHRRVDYAPGSSPLSSLKYRSKRITGFVSISKYIKGVLVNYGIRESKITTVCSAVPQKTYSETDKVAARSKIIKRHGLAEDSKIILNVAAITEQKNHSMLIKALGLFLPERKNTLAVICGSGNLMGNIQNEVKMSGLEQKIIFAGHQSDIESYFLAADLFALSSRDEGLGTSLLDAALYRLPICATQVGGIPEIIEHNITGLLSDAFDPKTFAANLASLSDNDELRINLVEKAFEHVAQNFSVEGMVEGNAELYRSIVYST